MANDAALVAMRRNSGGKTSTFFAAALRRFARKMKLNVSEKVAVGAASYVTVVFLIFAGSSARVGGQGYGTDNPGEQKLDEARAIEFAREGPAPIERVIDTDRGKGKASGKEAHDMTHSDATGGRRRLEQDIQGNWCPRSHASNREVVNKAGVWRIGDRKLTGQSLWPELRFHRSKVQSGRGLG
jgi:hypothetical protein